MVFSSDPAFRSSSAQPERMHLKDFRQLLWLVAGVEASIAIASFVALSIWQLSPYLLLIHAPVVGLVAFCMSFSIARQTGRIALGLYACLLANLGYFVGLIIAGALAFIVGFFSMADTYDGFDSWFGLIVTLLFLAIVMVGVEFGALLTSMIGGVLGSLLGKWRVQRFPKADGLQQGFK